MLVDLIRHGETEVRGLLLGRTDMALSERGREQFDRQTAGRTWASVITSPLRRARDPAQALAHLLDVPLRIDADWAEMDFGAWDGRDIAALRADADTAARLDAFYRDADAPGPPNGESWQHLRTRIARALATLSECDAADRVLVVSHGGPLRAALSIACGIAFEQTWSFRIDYGTRVTLQVGRHDDGRLWGEIVEMVQP